MDMVVRIVDRWEERRCLRVVQVALCLWEAHTAREREAAMQAELAMLHGRGQQNRNFEETGTAMFDFEEIESAQDILAPQTAELPAQNLRGMEEPSPERNGRPIRGAFSAALK